jgi:uncharacterized protein
VAALSPCETRRARRAVVVEYELAATIPATGVSASAPFIGVLTVEDGRVALWREYQNAAAIQPFVSP